MNKPTWCIFWAAVGAILTPVAAEEVCQQFYTPLLVYFCVTLSIAACAGSVSLCRFLCRPPDVATDARNKAVLKKQSEEPHDIGHVEKRESWEINYKDLKFGKKIGEGNVGVVYEGWYRGQKVAIKKLLGTWYADQDMIERFHDEIIIMSTMNHTNVLRFVGAVMDPSAGNICLVTELCARGTLYDIIHSDMKLDWAQRVSMACDIARGMHYLHERAGIIQRDLKSANLLVDEYLQVKIGDFGLSRQMAPGRMETYCGTPANMAPEVVRQEEYSEKADVFSFAIILWELITREDPYPNQTGLALAYLVADGLRPPVPAYCPAEYAHIMVRAWDADQEKRPSFEDILDVLQGMQRTVDAHIRVSNLSGTDAVARAQLRARERRERDLRQRRRPHSRNAGMHERHGLALVHTIATPDSSRAGSAAGSRRPSYYEFEPAARLTPFASPSSADDSLQLWVPQTESQSNSPSPSGSCIVAHSNSPPPGKKRVRKRKLAGNHVTQHNVAALADTLRVLQSEMANISADRAESKSVVSD